jgi:hypothetical protein
MQFSIELDEQLLQRAKHRANEQGTDLSSILLEYVQRYAANEKTASQTEKCIETDNPLQRLLNSGLVGCAKGDPDLSTNYKAELRSILDEKM